MPLPVGGELTAQKNWRADDDDNDNYITRVQKLTALPFLVQDYRRGTDRVLKVASSLEP